MENRSDRQSPHRRLVVGVVLALAAIALDAWALDVLGADGPALGELVYVFARL